MLVLVLGLTALVSCGGDNGDGNNGDTGNNGGANGGNNTSDNIYTINVVGDDGLPVEGVKLIISAGYQSLVTGKDGKASCEVADPTDLGVLITSVPEGYIKPETVTGTSYHAVFGDKKDVTITLAKEVDNKVTYTATVKDQNGDPVNGATVILCYNGICLTPMLTDESGNVTTELAPDTTVDVKLDALPEGYTKPAALDNGYHAVITDGDTSVTVTVTKG